MVSVRELLGWTKNPVAAWPGSGILRVLLTQQGILPISPFGVRNWRVELVDDSNNDLPARRIYTAALRLHGLGLACSYHGRDCGL